MQDILEDDDFCDMLKEKTKADNNDNGTGERILRVEKRFSFTKLPQRNSIS